MGGHLEGFVKVLFIFAIGAAGVTSQNTKKLSVVNNCTESVWPAIVPGRDVNNDSIAELKQGQSAVFNVPSNWSGLVWGRTGCNFDANGNGSCQTGGCESLRECTKSDGQSPTKSMALFRLGEPDSYQVLLYKGFNLPVVITVLKGKENCSNAGCDSDLRQSCPSQLALKSNETFGQKNETKSNETVIACKSICDVFKTEDSCCATEEKCRPSNYSKTYQSACPAAAIYETDPSTGLVSCTASEYVVSFCTSRNRTVCSDHKGKVSCNGSSGLTTGSPVWWALITLLPFMFTTPL